MLRAKILHLSPTRARVRIECTTAGEVIDQPEEQEEAIRCLKNLASSMEDLDGVQVMRVNLVTQTITLAHDERTEMILDHLRDFSGNSGVKLKKPKAKAHPRERLPIARRRMRMKVRALDERIIEFTKGEMDLEYVLAIALLGSGLYQTFSRGRFFPPGEVLLNSAIRLVLGVREEHIYEQPTEAENRSKNSAGQP